MKPLINNTKQPVFENEMCKSVGMWCTCNSCDRIIFEGEKYYEGGYCEECAKEVTKLDGTELEVIETII